MINTFNYKLNWKIVSFLFKFMEKYVVKNIICKNVFL